jgi:hypothetical protein
MRAFGTAGKELSRSQGRSDNTQRSDGSSVTWQHATKMAQKAAAASAHLTVTEQLAYAESSNV